MVERETPWGEAAPSQPSLPDQLPSGPAKPGPRGRTSGPARGGPKPSSLDALLITSLSERPGAGQRELAEDTGASQPTVSRALLRLVSAGWLTANAPMWPSHRKGQRYLLTPEGEARAKAFREELLGIPVGKEGLTLRDLSELHPGARLAELLRDLRDRPVGTLLAAPPVRPAAAPERPQAGSDTDPLVGRWAERQELLRLVSALQAPHPKSGAVFLLGSPGAGKSRLMRFVREVADRRGVLSREVRVTATPAFPFAPLNALFDADHLFTRGAEVTPYRRATVYLSRLEEDARRGVRLFVVEDLQSASPSVVTLLGLLLHRLAWLDPPVAFVVGVRRGDAPLTSELSGLLEDVASRRLSDCSTLELPPLRASESWELASLTLGERTATLRDRIAEVVARSGGNPLFLLEELRELQSLGPGSGVSEKEPPQLRGMGQPVPATLTRIVETRISRLPPRLQTLLEMAALLGTEFDLIPLEMLAAKAQWGNAKEVREALHELMAHWEFVRPAGTHRATFAHPLFREVLRDRNPHHVEWNRFLADWWARHHPAEVERVLSFHYRARDGSRIVPWAQKAVELALEQQAWENAEVYLGWLREVLGGGRAALSVRAPLELRTALTMRWAGAGRAAERVLRSMMREELPADICWEARVLLLSLMSANDPAAARARLRNVLGLRGRALPPAWRGAFLVQAAWLSLRGGQVSHALQQSGLALALLDRRPVRDYWTELGRITQATALYHLGREEEALAAASKFRTPKDPKAGRSLQIQLFNLRGRVWLTLGRPRQARREFRRGYELAREWGTVDSHGLLLVNLALSELTLEDLPEAERLTSRCIELGERFGHPLLRAWGVFRKAQIEFRQGNPEAEPLFATAERLFAELEMEGAARVARTYLIYLRADRKDPRSAVDALHRLGTRFSDVQGEERPPIDLFVAALWEKVPRPPLAQEAIERALRDARRRRHALFEAHALACLAVWHSRWGSQGMAAPLTRAARKIYARIGVPGLPGAELFMPPGISSVRGADAPAPRRKSA